MKKNMFKQKNQYQPTNGEEIPINTPFEYVAGQIPRRALSFLILGTAGVIGMLGLSFVTIFIIGTTNIIDILVLSIESIISIVFFLQSLLIYTQVIKKGEMAMIREHRGGIITFDKQPLNKPVYFNKKDKATELTILWNGSGTEKQSGARVLLLKEGNKTNENINLCVPETEWTKNLASMVKAKTFADLAEAELLNNKSLLGLKWQDLVLIITAGLTIITIMVLVGFTPQMVADAVTENLFNGQLQKVVQSVLIPTGV